MGDALDALNDYFGNLLLYNVEDILGNCVGLNHDTKLRKIYEEITMQSDIFAWIIVIL